MRIRDARPDELAAGEQPSPEFASVDDPYPPHPWQDPPCGWLAVVDERRAELEAACLADGEPPPTGEAVLSQVIYEAIAHFIEDELADDVDLEGSLDRRLVAWVDATGHRPAAVAR
jgi:hypothetical protein